MTEKTNKAGQPPKYRTEEALRDKIEEYFNLCRQSRDLPEKAGLCLYLGITRETLSQYRNHKYPDAVKSADLYIESCWVKRLSQAAPVGAIFYLKNAFKEEYKDKQEIDHGGELKISGVVIEVRKWNEIPKSATSMRFSDLAFG